MWRAAGQAAVASLAAAASSPSASWRSCFLRWVFQ
uniref:Uncharacterized protein n=1 Tax=Arundo donax TaxID=35708 RepID=A0A0A9HQ31_ARUDO